MAIVGNSLQIPMAVLMQIIVILLAKNITGVYAQKKCMAIPGQKKEQQLDWEQFMTNYKN